MANLGNLYFDIMVKDKTDAEIKKIKSKLVKELEATFTLKNIQVDKTSLVNGIKAALKGQTFEIDVKTKGGTAVTGNGSLTPGELRAVRAATLQAQSQAKIDNLAARTAATQQRMAAALARTTSAHVAAASAVDKHTHSLNIFDSAGNRAVGLLGSLRNELGKFAQIYFFQDLARSIVNTGGELENQRIAMGAILKDVGKAQTIFDKVQTLAVKSPFGVLQLNSYAKQLTAYSIPYNELYDTMKRLADVSAGVGVSMDRIILAYGQIKAKHVLAGTELRQLTEANLPIIDMLAKQYSAQEGRLVSASEIYDRISKKQVSFEDVKQAFKTMTDEGGQFYNMQDAMSESLKSKWKNLADAIDIAFGKVANGGIGDFLKGTAEFLTQITTQWQAVVGLIGGAVAGVKLFRLYTLLASRAMDMNTTRAFYGARSSVTYTDTSKLTGQARVDANRMNAQAASTVIGSLNQQNLLNQTKAKYLIMSKQVNQYEAQALRNLYGWNNAMLASYQNAGRLRTTMVGIKLLAAEVGTAFMSMLPMLVVSAAFSAVFGLIGKAKQRSDELKENLDSIAQASGESYKSLKGVHDEIASINPEKAGSTELLEAVSKMKTALKDYFPQSAGEEFDKAFGKDANGKVKTLSESFMQLKSSIEAAQRAVSLQKTMSEALEQTDNDNGGIFGIGASLSNVAEEYGTELTELDKYLRRNSKNSEVWSKGIQNVLNQTKGLSEYLDKAGISLSNISGVISAIAASGNQSWIQAFGQSAIDTKLSRLMYNVDTQREYLVTTAKEMSDEFIKAMNIKGIKRNSEEWNMAAQAALENFFDQHKVQDERVKQQIRDTFIEKKIFVHVQGVFSGEQDTMSDLQKYVDKMFGGEFTNQIKNGNGMAGAKDAIRKEVKSLQAEVEATRGVLKKMGINADGKKAVSETGLGAISGAQLDAIRAYNKALKEYNTGSKGLNLLGWNDSDEKKKGGARSNTDKELEKARRQLAELKEAYTEYKKLQDALGHDKALGEMKNSPFAAWFTGTDLTDEEYNRQLDKLRNSMPGASANRRAFRLDIDKIKFHFKEDALKKAADEAYAEIQSWLSDFTTRWDLYKSLNKTTGNREIAQLAFTGLDMWDESTIKLREKLEQEMSKNGIYGMLSFDMNNKEAEAFFNKNKGLTELYKEIQKQIRETGKTWLNETASMAAAVMTNEEKLENLKNKLQEVRDKAQNGEITTEDAEIRTKYYEQEIAKLEQEAFKLSDIYQRIFGSWDYMGAKKLRDMLKEINQLLASAKKDGKNGYTVTDTTGNTYKVTEGDLKSLTSKAVEVNKKLSKLDPFKQMAKSLKTLFKKDASENEKQQALQDLATSVLTVNEYVGELTSSFGNLFRAQGSNNLADTMEMVGTVSNSIGSVIQGFQSGGVVGGAVAALSSVANIMTKSIEQRNARLERQIAKSQRKITQLENYMSNFESKATYTLGNTYKSQVNALELNDASADLTRLRTLRGLIEKEKNSKGLAHDATRLEALQQEYALLEKIYSTSDGRVYQSQMQVLLAQKYAEVRELYTQMDKEWAKSGTSLDKIEEYKQKIKEGLQEIQDYEEEVANSLYGLDLKNWADDLSDTLVSAWLDGSDAADAYSEKVGDIMTDMVKKWMSVELVQPAMKQLQTMLFGEEGTDGFMSDGTLSEAEIAQIAGKMTGLQDNIGAWSNTVNGLIDSLKESGVAFSDSSTGLSKSIQGVTESTADLLASYINAMRADVSFSRDYLREIAQESLTGISSLAQQQLSELRAITSNTNKNVALVTEVRDLLKQNSTLGKGFKIA